MQSLWSDKEASQYQSELSERVYTSRLLGKEPALVLHGGGNTSVKILQTNLVGEEEEILFVKGSGWDLATIEEAGFAPVRRAYLLKLAKLDKLSDPEMVNELKCQQTIASAPTPSVETILHATLPYKFVDHTHADAIVTITNSTNGEQRIKEIYGERMVIIPYVMPGFDLARECAKQFAEQRNDKTEGMILLNHGIFSFAETAKESYELMIKLVTEAEQYLQQQQAWSLSDIEEPNRQDTLSVKARHKHMQEIAELRKEISSVRHAPVILSQCENRQGKAFANLDNVATISQQGPATPDHVIRTKRLPMLGRDLSSYQKNYGDYFKANNVNNDKTILDQAPRVILDSDLGLLSSDRTVKGSNVIADIYEHTMEIIQRAELLGGYRALPAKDIFDCEYWDLEQAKLKKSGKEPIFTGEIALVTGAASGIGAACVGSFLARGAAVVGLDINPEIVNLYNRPEFIGIECDITSEVALKLALERCVRSFGGLDILILNAGMFPVSERIENLSGDSWRQVMSVNLDANLTLLREAHSLLKLAPNGGRVTVIGSKNVPAPGPGAAAYSASKAALVQLARVTALEWSDDNIRINTLHPDAVFDTAIWVEEVLEARAKHYKITVDEYKRKNLLKNEITSHDVAELATELCSDLFAHTTGAQIPVDGGNERVI